MCITMLMAMCEEKKIDTVYYYKYKYNQQYHHHLL
jgi:hypothetical protein